MRPLATTLALVLLLLTAPSAPASPGWHWPVRGPVVTKYRNGADPYAAGQHRGIDIAAPTGAAVAAATAGTVTFAGPAGSSGLVVAVRTADGRFETSYLHLSAIRVRAGERVATGDELGAVGTTGRRSAVEPHLHFGVRETGTRFGYRDPLELLPVPVERPGPEPPAAPAPVAVETGVRSAPAPLVPTAGLSWPAPVGLPVAAHDALASSLTAAVVAPLAAVGPATALRVAASHAPVRGAAPERGRAPADVRRAPLPAAGPMATTMRAGHPAASFSARGRTSLGHRPGRHGGGIDLGWAAACVAMVALATLVGRPAGAARSVRRAFELRPAAARSSRAERA